MCQTPKDIGTGTIGGFQIVAFNATQEGKKTAAAAMLRATRRAFILLRFGASLSQFVGGRTQVTVSEEGRMLNPILSTDPGGQSDQTITDQVGRTGAAS
jgi:hypothetical protein